MPDSDFDQETDPRQTRYRDFAHTVRVVAARSLSEAAQVVVAKPNVVTRFAIERRAAAPTDALDIPTGEILARGGLLGISFAAVATDIQATLQLKGFAGVRAGAGRSGRLISQDGRIDAGFTFDARGAAACSFPDTPETRRAIDAVGVEIFDS